MEVLNYIKAAVYGLVEGITEWIPVSSTGHMILLNEILPMDVSKEFWNMFLVVIQFGAILAVVILYWSKIWPFGFVQHRRRKKFIVKKDVFMLWFKAIVACIPAAVVGLLIDDWLDEHLYNWMCVSAALIIVGIAFLIVEAKDKDHIPATNSIAEISFKQAFIVGIFQLIAAIFPGTSRSGATIIGGLMLGISRTASADFTFILAIPVMAGSSLVKLLKYGSSFTSEEIIIIATGMIVAFVVSLIVVRLFMGYIKKHDFKPFGWYRIVLGIVVILFFGVLHR